MIEYDKIETLFDRNPEAGPIRNKAMLVRLLEYRLLGWEVAVVAFHNDIENSKGTKDMVTKARASNVNTDIITEEEEEE